MACKRSALSLARHLEAPHARPVVHDEAPPRFRRTSATPAGAVNVYLVNADKSTATWLTPAFDAILDAVG